MASVKPTLTLTKIKHPFDRRDRDVLVYEYRGEPLSTIRQELPADVNFIVSVNGQTVPDEHLALVTPQPGDHIVFLPIAAGGDGDDTGKMVGRVIGMIVVAALSIYASGLSMPAMWGLTGAQVAMVAGAAVAIVGGVLVGAIFAPKAPSQENGSQSNAYGWMPQTMQRQGIPLARWYGTNKIVGNIISGFIDSEGSNQTMNALISLGLGPMAINAPDKVTINDQPYFNYREIPAPSIRRGDLNQSEVPGFNVLKVEHRQAVQVILGTPYTYVTTGDTFDSLVVEISFPNGLYHRNARGGRDLSFVDYQIDISPHGTNQWQAITRFVVSAAAPVGSGYWSLGYWSAQSDDGGYTYSTVWVPLQAGSSVFSAHLEGDAGFPGYVASLPTVWHWVSVDSAPIAEVTQDYRRIQRNSTDPITLTYETGPLTHGKYDVRVSKLAASEYDDDANVNDMYLTNVREVSDVKLVYPRQALVGLKALATSQLNGSLNFGIIADGAIVRVYNGSAWSSQFSNNPAWVLWDVLTQPVLDNNLAVVRYDGIDPSRLDLPKFYELAQWCDVLVPDGKGGTEKRITFNGGFDAEISMWDAALQVCQVAGCALIPTGTGYTLAIEKPNTPVQLFSVGNIGEGSFKESFLPIEDRASEIQVDFLDKDQNYERTQISCVNSNIKTITNKVTVQAVGVTSASEAWRLAMRQLRYNELILRTIEFTADIDSIACTVGDVINFQHDVPQWGFGGRIVSATSTTVTLDQQVTLAAGTTYSVMVRLSDDTIVTRTVTTGAGTTDTLTVSAPFTSTPQQYDVYAFGVSGLATKPFRVCSIHRSGDLQATITAVEYNEAVYDDSGAPAIPAINYSALEQYAIAESLAVAEHSYIAEGGAFRRNLDVSWSASGASPLRFDIFMREDGLPWQQAGNTTDTSFTIESVKAETTYIIMVVGVNSAGQSAPYAKSPTVIVTTSSTTGAVTAIGGTAVTGLSVYGGGSTFKGRDCCIVWTAPDLASAIDHYKVEILNGVTVLRTETVTNASYTYTYGRNYDDRNGTPLASFTVRVTAVDIGGGESTPATLTISNTIPAAPTALTASAQFMGISLSATYTAPEDFDCLEVWSSTTNAAPTSLVKTTKTATALHDGLGTASLRYYWVRIRDIYGQYSAYYPSGNGVQGTTLTDPTEALKLLNDDVTSQSALDYFLGKKTLINTLDTGSLAFTASAAGAGVGANYTATIMLNDRQILAQAEEIQFRASKGELSAQVDILSNMIGLKLNATGTVSPGMAISWTDDTHTRSNITFLTDTLLVAKPDGSGAKNVFSIGTINGVSTVGIDGDLVVDGSIGARAIATDELIVGTNIAMGPNATISWSKVTSAPTIPTNTNQLTDGANLGGTATWNGLGNKPANIAALTGSEAIKNSLITLVDLGGMPINPQTPTNIGANWIYTGILTAAQVNALVINANTISFIDTANGYIALGKSSAVDDSHAGFWLGNSGGVAKFSIGNATEYLKWTGSGLAYTGKLGSEGQRVINGIINGVNGTIMRGTEFTFTKIGTGSYRITHGATLNNYPAAVASLFSLFAGTAYFVGTDAQAAYTDITVKDAGGVSRDAWVSFVIIG